MPGLRVLQNAVNAFRGIGGINVKEGTASFEYSQHRGDDAPVSLCDDRHNIVSADTLFAQVGGCCICKAVQFPVGQSGIPEHQCSLFRCFIHLAEEHFKDTLCSVIRHTCVVEIPQQKSPFFIGHYFDRFKRTFRAVNDLL